MAPRIGRRGTCFDRDAAFVTLKCRAPGEQLSRGFGPRRREGGLQLPDSRPFRTARSSHATNRRCVRPQPLVVNPETARPARPTVDDDPADVGSILEQMQSSETKGTVRLHEHAPRGQVLTNLSFLLRIPPARRARRSIGIRGRRHDGQAPGISRVRVEQQFRRQQTGQREFCEIVAYT